MVTGKEKGKLDLMLLKHTKKRLAKAAYPQLNRWRGKGEGGAIDEKGLGGKEGGGGKDHNADTHTKNLREKLWFKSRVLKWGKEGGERRRSGFFFFWLGGGERGGLVIVTGKKKNFVL